jgi:hypothetical protein
MLIPSLTSSDIASLMRSGRILAMSPTHAEPYKGSGHHGKVICRCEHAGCTLRANWVLRGDIKRAYYCTAHHDEMTEGLRVSECAQWRHI